MGIVASLALPATFGEWLVIGIALFAAVRITRGGGGTAVTELSEANRVLKERDHRRDQELRDTRAELVALRARTDFAAVMELHETRAIDRHEAQLRALERIADRLGAAPGAAEMGTA